MLNKHIILTAISLFFCTRLSAQKVVIDLDFNGFEPEEKVILAFDSGEKFKLDPSEGPKTVELDSDIPVRGYIAYKRIKGVFLKNRLYEIFVDPGENTIDISRNYFKKRTKIVGSSSHQMFRTYLKSSKKKRREIRLANSEHPFFNACAPKTNSVVESKE